MSRVAKNPVNIPNGVEVKIDGDELTAKGPRGSLFFRIHDRVQVTQKENALSFLPRDAQKSSVALSGTARSVVNNLVVGVSFGFEKKLVLSGVGYRAQAQGKQLSLSLGFSHPIDYAVPEGVEIETPAATEIIVRGCDKQRIGQVCAEIRALRPPEPYKGKGVKYLDEEIIRKEAKKK